MEEEEKQEQVKKTRVEVLEETLFELIDNMEKMATEVSILKTDVARLSKGAIKKPKGLFGGERTPVAILDTKTKVLYPSQASTARELAHEIGESPDNHFAWYPLNKAFPDRFERVSEDDTRVIALRKKIADELEKANIEANKRMAEEEAKKPAGEAEKPAEEEAEKLAEKAKKPAEKAKKPAGGKK